MKECKYEEDVRLWMKLHNLGVGYIDQLIEMESGGEDMYWKEPILERMKEIFEFEQEVLEMGFRIVNVQR